MIFHLIWFDIFVFFILEMVRKKGRCTVTIKRFTGDLLLSSTHAGKGWWETS
jgi:hypothetical protein